MTIVSRRRRTATSPRLIQRDAFITLLSRSLRRRWETGFADSSNVADNIYYLPSLRQVRRILRLFRRQFDEIEYASDRFDCDDFAWMLKGTFCRHAAGRRGKSAGWAVGVVWTNTEKSGQREGHAYNWVITKERELWMIEPQSQEMWRCGERDCCRINYDRNIVLIVG